MHDPCHELDTELKFGAKRVHVAEYFQKGTGPWQFAITGSGNAKTEVNSFKDLAVARSVSGVFGTEKANEVEHSLIQAREKKVDKMKAAAKARGGTKRKLELHF